MTLNISCVVSVVCLLVAAYLIISREFTKFDLDITKTPSLNFKLTPQDNEVERLLLLGKTTLGWFRCAYFFDANAKYGGRVIKLLISESRSAGQAVLYLMKSNGAAPKDKYLKLQGVRIEFPTSGSVYAMETPGIKAAVTVKEIRFTGWEIDYVDFAIEFHKKGTYA